MLADGDAGAPGAVDDAFRFADIFFDHFQGIEQGSADDHGGTVLIVMENRDITDLLQFPLDFEAAGSGDILQVDAAEGTGDQVDCADDFIHILAADADRERVHIAESLEKGAFALHHRHAGLGPDIAEAEDRCTVGDDSDKVAPPGQGEGFFIILLDLQAGLSHTGGVGQGKVVLGFYGDAGNNLDFPFPFAVQAQGFLSIIQ